MAASKPRKEPGQGRNRPCEQCRSRKVRCMVDEGIMSCARCIGQDVECSFAQSTPLAERKRSLDILGAVAVPAGKKRAMSMNGGSASAEEARSLDNDPFNGRDPNIPANSLLNSTVGLAKDFHARYIGATSSFPSTLLKSTPNRTTYLTGTIRRVSDDEQFLTEPDALTSGFDGEADTLDAIEACVAPHGKSLVNLYFRIVHPSFPILHKRVFYEKYARTYREFSPPLLAVVYIQALQWWEYGSDLPFRGQKPDEQKLRALAQESIFSVLNRPKLSTVQAGLLLAQGGTNSSGPLLTQVVAVAHELGLHLDCSDWSIPNWEKGLRKRLAWAVFMQDKWGSVISGRPSYIHASDWLVKPVTESDFPERADDEDEEEGSTEVEKGRELFTQMISLSQILSKVSSNFYTLSSLQKIRQKPQGNIRALLETAQAVQGQLKAWNSQLPESLSIANVQARKLSSVGYLHLAFWAVQTTLHRAVLRLAVDGCRTAESTNSSEHDLFSVCYKAASSTYVSAASLITSFRPEHLQSFWYFSSAYSLALIGSLGCELWAATADDAERTLWKRRLGEYRWTLRVSAKGVDFIGSAVDILNEMIQVLEEAEAKAGTSRKDSLSPGLAFQQSATATGAQGHDLLDHSADSAFEYPSFDLTMLEDSTGGVISYTPPASGSYHLISSAEGSPSAFFGQYSDGEAYSAWLPR